MHFLNISTSKKCPHVVCFAHFDFEMCFPATTACTDSTAPLRRALLRASGIFHVLTSKCASCHSGVHFLNISTSQSAPNLKRFCHLDFKIRLAPQRLAIFDLSSDQMTRQPAALASLLYDPPQPQNIGKTHCFAIFLPLRALINFLLALSSLMDLFGSFSSLALLTTVASSAHKSEVWTSKLPSNIVGTLALTFLF